jgi:hypothetical protein
MHAHSILKTRIRIPDLNKFLILLNAKVRTTLNLL